jgi:hypothetical protein
MKLLNYLLPTFSSFIVITLAQGASHPAWPDIDITTDPNNLELVSWDKEAEGSRFTIE